MWVRKQEWNELKSRVASLESGKQDRDIVIGFKPYGLGYAEFAPMEAVLRQILDHFRLKPRVEKQSAREWVVLDPIPVAPKKAK